jgi:hypothetical protein
MRGSTAKLALRRSTPHDRTIKVKFYEGGAGDV